MYIADIKLVEWFSYISWIVSLFFIFISSFRSSSFPKISPLFREVHFFVKFTAKVGQKKGGFDVKENYFYKCGNKSLSFNHVAAWVCVKEKCHGADGLSSGLKSDFSIQNWATPESLMRQHETIYGSLKLHLFGSFCAELHHRVVILYCQNVNSSQFSQLTIIKSTYVYLE